jgi:RNA polymerase sigma factor (sigma-70 family)
MYITSKAFKSEVNHSYHTLSHEVEVELVLRAKGGCKASQTKLINSQLPQIIRIANGYVSMNTRMSIGDLISEGVIGLIGAIASFDPTRGYRLFTYAMRPIADAMRDASVDNQCIRVPRNLSKSRKATKKERLATGEDRVKGLIIPTTNMDMPINEDGTGLTIHEVVPDESITRDEEHSDMAEKVSVILSTLNDDERELMQEIYGVGDSDKSSMEDIGIRRGVTKQTISVRHKRILKKIQDRNTK